MIMSHVPSTMSLHHIRCIMSHAQHAQCSDLELSLRRKEVLRAQEALLQSSASLGSSHGPAACLDGTRGQELGLEGQERKTQECILVKRTPMKIVIHVPLIARWPHKIVWCIQGDKTGQDRTGQERPGQARTEQDRTGQDRTGQDRTGKDRTGQDRAGQCA